MPGEYKEEYLGAIYSLTEKGGSAKTNEIAEKLGVKAASVTGMLKTLADEDYVEYTPYKGATLTPKGLKVARKLKRKHRLLERFLYDVLGLHKNQVHDEACRMEHSLSDEAAKALDEVMDYPETCPDDHKRIPRNGEAKKAVNEERLISIEPGTTAKILRLEGGRGFQTNARTMGLKEGTRVNVITREPFGGPLVVKTGNTTVTLGRGMAFKIIVKKKE